VEAADLVKNAGLYLGIQLMPGLPGEDEDSWEQTIVTTAEITPNFVRLYPALVVEGTPLAEMYRSGVFTSLSIEAAAQRCVYAIERLEEAGIRIERVGLQETVGLSEEIIAGPYHPAFGEIACGYLMRKRIEEAVGDKRGEITVSVAPEMVSTAVGHKRTNIEYFSETYGISVRIVPDGNLRDYEVKLQ
jgi:histone acetyltransferase (RNA polymerase elongator complex component)